MIIHFVAHGASMSNYLQTIPPDQWQPLNVQTGCKLCNKILDAHMYLEAKAVHEQFTTDENLEMLNHEFDSKKMKQ